MAKKFQLKERDTNVDIYPVTTTDAVLDKDGNPITDSLVPKGGQGNQILSCDSEGNTIWTDLAHMDNIMLDTMSYGVQWTDGQADPTLTRVGNMQMHRELPIQSGIKGCVCETTPIFKVVYWLNENDWRLRKKPTTVTSEVVELGDLETPPPDKPDGAQFGVPISSDAFLTLNALYPRTYLKIQDMMCRIIAPKTSELEQEGTGQYVFFAGVDLDDQLMDDIYLDISKPVDIEIGSNLYGYDGEVMNYIPEFYIRSWEDGDKREVRISTVNIDGTWEHQPSCYISVYGGIKLSQLENDSTGYLSRITNKDTCISSCAQLEPQYWLEAGGSPTYSISKHISTSEAINKLLLGYKEYKNIIYWLPILEYATFNLQLKYTDELTLEGFRKGGLGNVNMINSANIPDRFMAYLGNRSGTKQVTYTVQENTTYPLITSWRGFSCLKGWKCIFIAGLWTWRKAQGDLRFLCTTDPSKYGLTNASEIIQYTENIGQGRAYIGLTSQDFGYNLHLGTNACNIPEYTVWDKGPYAGLPNATSTTYVCSNFDTYSNDIGSSKGLFRVHVGTNPQNISSHNLGAFRSYHPAFEYNSQFYHVVYPE